MTAQKSAFLGLIGVSLLWGCNYVISAYLLRSFSPIFLSFARMSMTALFLIAVVWKFKGLRRPSLREWTLLVGAGFFGTLLNQVFYFTGLRQSTPANAALIIAMSPVVTTLLERVTLKVPLTIGKIVGVLLGLAGVIVIVGLQGPAIGVSIGDLFLLIAMLTMSISIMFVRGLTENMSAFSITIYSTVLGSILMAPAAGVEALAGATHVSHTVLPWILMAAAAVVAQALAGFWWNRGVAIVGAGAAAMFMNIPPFVALFVAHWTLGDAIHGTQILGGILVLLGVLVANERIFRTGRGKPQLPSELPFEQVEAL